jgi:pimeloyl-ACP methyl ester carboxylesterase
MPTIVANGLQTAYEVQGVGPPLIMLHGATTSGPEHFARLAPALAQGFRVYLPDARGHAGTAGDPDDGFTTADLVQDVLAFVDELGLSTFHLLGYSMGGMTALHVAAQVPERLRTLVAISICTEREPRLSVGRSLMDPDRIERHDPGWARALAARHDPLHGPGSWRTLLRAIVKDIGDQPLLTPVDLRRIDAPALVVAGDRDPFTPVPQAHALSRQVRDGRLLILPGLGHDALSASGGLLEPALIDFYRSTESLARDRAGESTERRPHDDHTARHVSTP